MGTPHRCINSFEKALDPSSCAPALPGPKTRCPSPRRRSARPRISGSSGPITTKSGASSRMILRTLSRSLGFVGMTLTSSAMPGLPPNAHDLGFLRQSPAKSVLSSPRTHHRNLHLLSSAAIVEFRHVLLFAFFGEVSESNVGGLEPKQNGADISVSVLGDVDLGNFDSIRISIRFAWLLTVAVVLLSVNHHDDIGFRFDRTRLTNVAELGTFIVPALDRSVELTERDNRNLELFGHRLQKHVLYLKFPVHDSPFFGCLA